MEKLSGIITSLKTFETKGVTRMLINNKHLGYCKGPVTCQNGDRVELAGEWKQSEKAGKYLFLESAEGIKVVENLQSDKPLSIRIYGRKHAVTTQEEEVLQLLEPVLEYLLDADQKPKAKKIASLSPTEALAIHNDPHKLYSKLVTFEMAETIAQRMGTYSRDGRLNAAASEILEKSYNSGKTFITIPFLLEELNGLLKTEVDEAEARTLIRKKVAVITKDGQVFIPKIYYLRERTLAMVAKNRPSMQSHDDEKLDGLLGHYYSILTGAAGTGKTTHLREVKSYLEGQGYKVALTAMTGKATSVLGNGATTLHKLLGYGHGGFSVKGVSQDVVIVDEASMMDWYTAHTLFKAVGEGRIILSGDPNQLPPVKGGSVFAELIALLPLSTVKLEKVHRFVGGEANVQVIQRKNIQDLLSTTTTLAITMARKGESFQVLTPVLGSIIGTYNLNRILQGKLNPNGRKATDKYRLGDRVILTKNCYNKEAPAFNGQVGYIVDVEENQLIVKLESSNEVLPFSEEEIELAYSLTVHKAQGSQFDKVIFVAPKSQCGDFLDEKMMYTGNTRGKVATYCLVA